MDSLFPALPADLKSLSDEDLAQLLTEHEAAAQLIDDDDAEFTKGLEADEILAAYETGVDQMDVIRAEQKDREDAIAAFEARKAELAARRKGADDEPEEEETEEASEEEAVEAVAEADEPETDKVEEEVAEEVVETPEPIAASAKATSSTPKVDVRLRRAPKPTPEREAQQHGAQLVASAGLETARGGQVLDRGKFAELIRDEARRWGKPTHHQTGVEERKLVARAEYHFPPERRLTSDYGANQEAIRAVMPPGAPISGNYVASGGLCAPLTPIYTLPNFATTDRPVRDSLPSFNAERGGANVPAAPYIGDITTAISTITEPNDALGGTYATKSCQDLDCVDYTEVPVTVLAHCREYGNLNARAWPERIALENDLTMAAHARTAEAYLLDRIKALSVNVTNGLETLGALIYLVDGIVKSKFGIQGRLRMSPNSRFRVLLPSYAVDLLLLDTIQTQFDRYRTRDQITAYLNSYNIDVTYYLDTPSTGDSQLPDSSQTAAAIDGFPNNVQWAIFPEGGFIHIDGGSLELGIVRDSTLNSTNDFQVFGETFENVARLAPAQAAYWVSTDWCPIGQFPPAGTARTCE